VTLSGRDIIDTPLEVRSGQSLSGVTLVFTDKLSEVSGTITDDRGQPITEFTVLAFPTDNTLWRPQARQIMTARPDQTGQYQMRGLPPGDYYVTAVDPTEQGEWFEPGRFSISIAPTPHDSRSRRRREEAGLQDFATLDQASGFSFRLAVLNAPARSSSSARRCCRREPRVIRTDR
jgi:hypothetical protein